MTDRDPFQTLWTNQKEEPFNMTLADIQARATRFRSTVRNRNITEYAAAALVIAIFGWMAVLIPVLTVKAGALLIILGALYVCWKLHTLAGVSAKAERDAAVSVTDFHRAELQRQRAALSTVWRWYLAPFVPGMLVFVGGVTLASGTGLPLAARLATFAVSLGLMAAVFVAIWWLNQRAVAALDEEIKALEAGRK
jgi:hypothetical protein